MSSTRQSLASCVMFLGLTMSCCLSAAVYTQANPPGDTPAPPPEIGVRFEIAGLVLFLAGGVVTWLGWDLQRVRRPAGGAIVVKRPPPS